MWLVLFFFFNDTATTEIYTLSLHDALPIFESWEPRRGGVAEGRSPEAAPSFCCIESWEPRRGGAPKLRPVFVALKAGSRGGAEPRSCAQFLLH